MSLLCIVVLCLITGVVCGYIDINYDRVVNNIGEDSGGKIDQTMDNVGFVGFDVKQNNRAIDIGGKDMMIQLAMAAMLKMYTVLPLVLGSLGLIAGFTVATSKAAFLLLSAVAVYVYISEQKLWPTTAKETGWPYLLQEMNHFNLQSLYPQHQLYQDHLHQPRIVLRRVVNT